MSSSEETTADARATRVAYSPFRALYVLSVALLYLIVTAEVLPPFIDRVDPVSQVTIVLASLYVMVFWAYREGRRWKD